MVASLVAQYRRSRLPAELASYDTLIVAGDNLDYPNNTSTLTPFAIAVVNTALQLVMPPNKPSPSSYVPASLALCQRAMSWLASESPLDPPMQPEYVSSSDQQAAASRPVTTEDQILATGAATSIQQDLNPETASPSHSTQPRQYVAECPSAVPATASTGDRVESEGRAVDAGEQQCQEHEDMGKDWWSYFTMVVWPTVASLCSRRTGRAREDREYRPLARGHSPATTTTTSFTSPSTIASLQGSIAQANVSGGTFYAAQHINITINPHPIQVVG
ncbi:hypothetical protein BKA70DRAFT_1221011 [Coprinopsis sp. MPI-PUGE-AT-0042]|nr:hypothetical protein BKA70DRAFT_1221011 [Coprinopsis sp. MPI-PUGE-AT-0042]